MRCLCYPVFVLLLAGCASYVGQTGAFRGAWNSGSIEQAAQLATREANQRSESRDSVIWFLEQGAALRATGQFAASNQAFEQAENRIRFYDRQASVPVSYTHLTLPTKA